MPLTTTEKQHWRDRIAKRIEKKIAGITALDPGLFSRIESQARTRAIESLGLAEFMTGQARVEKEMQQLKSREEQLTRDVLSRLRGIEPDKIDSYSVCRSDNEINNAIKARQTVHEETLLREHDLGRQITQLRLEKENLLDTVFLATSPTQVRTLWEKVSDLLGDELSQLQQAAMQIQPPSD